MDFLLFRLYGPMASWGEIAVGETRNTANYPSKSAIIGLMAAALGIKRDQTDIQQQMQDGYAIAVEVFSQGSLLRDYHTTQVPDSVGKFRYQTRRDELVLGKSRLGTILSSREYRTDGLAVIAVKTIPNAPYNLHEIKTHLEKPKYHLYLGRKSCPFAAPMSPQLIAGASNYYSAFNQYEHKPLMPTNKPLNGGLSDRDTYWIGVSGDRHYYWEGPKEDFSDSVCLEDMQTRTRHDQPLSRQRWQFVPRQEHYLYIPGGE